jgi:penicillin-binding protein 1C
MKIGKHIKQNKIRYAIALMIAITWYYFSLPATLFSDPYSTVVEASDGQLLSASIAADGQWRFPLEDSVPGKFAQALITFEDKRFEYHPGVDVLSMGRALIQNLRDGKVVSGGSTITMQVIRLSRKTKSRNVFSKALETILATRLELRHTKDEILSLYAAHAPFGGNVVGLHAACWRYFGRDPSNLSWAEASLLAVLPNAPALIHPGKNRLLLKAKRDRLLDKLYQQGMMDSLSCELAKAEHLPEEPLPLPRHARHLISRMVTGGMHQKKLQSTIDYDLQLIVERLVNEHHERLRANQVHNAAVIVMEVSSGNVLAYCGNTESGPEHEADVDMVIAPRSTGSILKPFLYAALQDEGQLLPSTLVPDVPIIMEGFSPKNFSKQYDGVVPADQALIRSLNVPAVNELKVYNYAKFYMLLRQMGMTTLTREADHYGLSLILGGAEGTLWDIAGIYASMARTLNNYFQSPGVHRYNKQDYHPPSYHHHNLSSSNANESTSFLSAASIFLTFKALQQVYRPGEETGWRHFTHSKQIAWKTGTSFGHRDGWAVGVTPEYVVGVLVGNADGEGRPGLTGTDAASPLMFDVFSRLPATTTFREPLSEMKEVIACRQSGHRASDVCVERDTVMIAESGANSKPCPYHRIVHLSADRKFRVHSDCAKMDVMHHEPWFVLNPVEEFYYKAKHLRYMRLPPFAPACDHTTTSASMDLIYPRHDTRILIPKELNGEPGSAVFELAHRQPDAEVYWHLDGEYIGMTKTVHHLPFNPAAGKHILTLVDNRGESVERRFEVISKM